MDFRILGPLEVLDDGRALDLGGAKQRAVVAMLALHANRVVAQEQLIDALWDEEPPETARKAVQVYVSQLRKLLGRERLETKGRGYLLRLGPDELDLARFERLRDSGKPNEALSLWRGDALADFADHRFAQAEISRLEELRLSCLEQRIERDLAEGRHAELVGELAVLAEEHPLREHLRAQLMLALYRAGRQAEALEAYQAARSALVDELGIEPAHRLRELHQQILTQDPALDLPAPKPPVRAAPAARPSPGPAPAPTAAVRKTVTVLFCDLADSTALGERLDPESLRTLMERWYEAMRGAVERHGGTVEKFIGDAVMAVFGVPQVHEDDALRAVRAAVEMRVELARLNAQLTAERRQELEIRVGINTGEVVTGDGSTTLVTGDPVNTAKRLEEAAASGEILIGTATRRLVGNATELEPAEPVAARGKRLPVEAWRVLGTIPGAAPFARRLDAPLVGRRRELAFLHDELAGVERDRACRLVTVFGTAGIGKSRLAAELLAEAGERAAVLKARCLPYGDGITFLPLNELVRSAGGEEAIMRSVESEPDGALIVERICGTIDPGSTPISSEETFWAIRRLLETLARERTLVVCLEDVHWAQPTFLDLLEYVAGWSRDAPILLFCLSRPDLLELRPGWSGPAVTLEPLTPSESGLLLDELGAEWPLSADERARVADAAEGNPLFLEQMVAMLAEGKAAELPPTIQALLAARLDLLAPAERAVLERAAVVGKEFWRGAVAELSPADEQSGVSSVLLALVRKELVRPEPSAFLGDDGFRFRHVLIRDAAYAAIPKAVRADIHEAFVSWLERHGAEDELVGYHLEQAYWYRADLGERDGVLAARAGELLGTAGARAGARGDVAAALTLLRRGLALLPPQHASRIELLRELSTALWLDGDVDAAELTLSESIDAARAAGDTRLEWYGRLERAARNAVMQGETEALVATAEHAVQVFDELGDALGLARAWRRVGFVAHTERRLADAAAAFESALTHAEASGDEQERARSADALCTALLFGPARVDDAVERAESIVASAGRNVVLRAHVSTTLAGLVAMRGEFERARELYGEAGAVYEELGLRLPKVGWTEVVASVELLAGDAAAAVRALRSGYAVLDSGGFDSLRTHFAALLAFVLATEGDVAGARSFVHICEGSSGTLGLDTTARLRAAQAVLESEPVDAERLAREAVAAAAQTDDLNLQAAMRLVLARLAGDPAEAAEARRLFDAKGNVAAAAATGLWSYQT
jgi:class 3 adenylate cyclase/DNA-binding SARP family transcriptional activator